MTIIIIDNYDSFTYNLYQLLQEQTEDNVQVYRNDRITLDELVSMKPSAVVLSPGPGHPGNQADFGVCADIICQQEKLGCPILGVCLGHQGIIHHLGGKVMRAPQIVHGKSSEVRQTESSRLFKGLPKSFQAMRYHSLVGEPASIPSCLRVTALTSIGTADHDQRADLVMAVEHRTKPIYGVQFHPESIGTPDGKKMLRNFLELC